MRKLLIIFAVAVAGALVVLLRVSVFSRIPAPSRAATTNPSVRGSEVTPVESRPQAGKVDESCGICANKGTPSAPRTATVVPRDEPRAGEAAASVEGDSEVREHEDLEFWDAVQATLAERELARQENLRESHELDQATDDLNHDQLLSSEYKARLREIGLRHRQRLVEIFGQERATKIKELQQAKAQEFFDRKYGSE